MIKNIIFNAIKASSSEGVIHVLLQVDGRVEVTVTDREVGIALEELMSLNKNEGDFQI